jgi:sec-independent protein translocase protein TatA
MPFGIGPMELLIVAILALLVLGPKRLPQAGRSLGQGMREFRSAVTGGKPHEDEDAELFGAAHRRDVA